MTIRYYILPIIRTAGDMRTAKYFAYPKGGLDGIHCDWTMKDYGAIDRGIVCANILDADHTSLVANADVLAPPVNIDTTMTAGAVSTAKTFLEGFDIPAGWINTSDTYRSVLRTITAFFLYMQRVTGVLGHGFVLPSGWTNLQINQVPVDIRNAMAQAATSFEYDYSWVTGTTTVRLVLKGMADAWGTKPIYFGLATF